MKIAFLAPANSIHTQKWVVGLCARGHEVTLFTQHRSPIDAKLFEGGTVEWLPYSGAIGYFLNAIRLRSRLDELRPDILNAHYASGYGTTAALTGFKPLLLSVWGSDVFDFPYQSWWRKVLLRRNLRSATKIASTSHVMARQVRLLDSTLPLPVVTPFGVDTNRFFPDSKRDRDFITVGTVKTLTHKYGVDLLIDAFARLLQNYDVQKSGLFPRLRLILVGGGEERAALEARARSLNIADRVRFVGAVPHEAVPDWLNRLDIYVAASRYDSESFGVAVVEASACGVPVVVSDAGGLPEVVQHGVTGLVVPRENSQALANALSEIVLDEACRRGFGEAGRIHVLKHYEWEHCVDTMISVYERVIEDSRR